MESAGVSWYLSRDVIEFVGSQRGFVLFQEGGTEGRMLGGVSLGRDASRSHRMLTCSSSGRTRDLCCVHVGPLDVGGRCAVLLSCFVSWEPTARAWVFCPLAR